MQVAQIRNLV